MTQKKYERRLQKKQFLSLMIRRAETREILRERKEKERKMKQQLQIDDMIDEILLHYKETESLLKSVCEKESDINQHKMFLFTYFEDHITSKLFLQSCRRQNLLIQYITKREYEQFLYDFDFIRNYILKNELN